MRNSSLISGDLDSWKALAGNGLYIEDVTAEQSEAIKQHYFGNATCVADIGPDMFFQNITSLFSDRHFFSGFEKAVASHASHSPVYVYYFNYIGEFSLADLLISLKGEAHVIYEMLSYTITTWFRKIVWGVIPESPGVCHAEDPLLLFNLFPPFTTIGQHNKDFKMSKALVKLWVTFATSSHR